MLHDVVLLGLVRVARVAASSAMTAVFVTWPGTDCSTACRGGLRQQPHPLSTARLLSRHVLLFYVQSRVASPSCSPGTWSGSLQCTAAHPMCKTGM